MPESLFAIGASLAALENVETPLGFAPHVLQPGSAIPLVGPRRRQTLDRAVQRNGAINVAMQWSMLRKSALLDWIVATWGDYLTASKALYASWWDETGHYSPFAVTLERPVENEHYRVVNGTWVADVRVPGWGWTLQKVAKSGDYTVTTSDRLIEVDTSGGDVTLTLPAASAPNPYTVFSFVVVTAGNDLILDGDGAETIDGDATKTLTALNARADLYSTGAAWITI